MSETDEQPEPTSYLCPECGQPVEPPAALMENVVVCPNCGHQFFINVTPVDEEDEEAVRAEMQKEMDRARDLDGARIRALSVERRATIRQRSYFVVGAGACVVGIGQSIYMLILGRSSMSEFAIPFSRGQRLSLFILILWFLYGARFFFRKVKAYNAELSKPVLTDPIEPPDFEPLSDGSQTWKQLEEMNRVEEEE